MIKILMLAAAISLIGPALSYGAEDPKRDQAMEEALQSVMSKNGQQKAQVPDPGISKGTSTQAKPKKPPRRSLFSRLF